MVKYKYKIEYTRYGHKSRKQQGLKPKRNTKTKMYKPNRGGWDMKGKWDKFGATHHNTGRSASVRVFAEDLQVKITKAIQSAATNAALFAKSQLMEMARLKYEELGLNEHELTGNTRNSIMSAVYSGGKMVGGVARMEDTPPATGPMLSLHGDDRLVTKGSYRYFIVRHYRTGKFVKYPYWKVVDTSGGYAFDESLEYLKTKLKGNPNIAAEIHVVGMQESYRPELATLMQYLRDNAQIMLYEFLKEDLKKRIEWNKGFAEAMRSYRKK